jgi:hypothetical protein
MNYPSPYATLGSGSSSNAGPTGSSTALNNGYGTIRKAGLPSPASTSRPTTDSVTYVRPWPLPLSSPSQRGLTLSSECSVTLAQKLEELATANADGLLRFARCVLNPARADTLTSRLHPVVMTNIGCFVKTFSRDSALWRHRSQWNNHP